jgi:hypothetical protein
MNYIYHLLHINNNKNGLKKVECYFRSDEFTDNNWIKNEIKQGLLNLQETYTGKTLN